MTFVAYTSHGAHEWIVATGDDKQALREQAQRLICGDQWDQAKNIFIDTELKNLRVTTRKQAARERHLRWAIEEYEQAS